MAHKLNLIPTDILEREEWQRALLWWGKIAFFGILVITTAYAGSRLWIASLKYDVEQLLHKTAVAETLQKEIGRLRIERERLLEIEHHYQHLSEKGPGSLILAEVGQALPLRARLRRLEITVPDQVMLQGEAVSNTDLAEFLARLSESKQFPNPVLVFSRVKTNPQGHSITFEIKQSKPDFDAI